jgi:hypothetical protein
MSTYRQANPQRSELTPNPSLERTPTGLALGPLPGVVHHPSSGPSAIPASARSAQTLGRTASTSV